MQSSRQNVVQRTMRMHKPETVQTEIPSEQNLEFRYRFVRSK